MFLENHHKGLLPKIGLVILGSFFLLSSIVSADYYYTSPPPPTYQSPSTSSWIDAHATFYGDESASSTTGGACGYGNIYNTAYGTNTAAFSTVLYQNGLGCGQCIEIKCVDSPHCYTGNPSVKVTGTNLCPPNWAQASDDGGWCNPPRSHFDMAKPAFMQIADWHAGIVPVKYRRVSCTTKGGIQFTLNGNAYWLLVYVSNVGGAGDIDTMSVKGDNTDWTPMTRNWGISFQVFSTFCGQGLSFKITSHSTGQTIIVNNAAPSNWQFGMTYQGQTNFDSVTSANY